MSAPRGTRLALFGRPPVPGRVKTRLALDGAHAATLYAAFVHDLLARVRALDLPFTLWIDGSLDDPTLAPFDAPLARQVGADLGERMSHAFEVELARAERVVLIGTDVPTLPPRIVAAACRALDRHEVAFAPSEDGGYVLVAARVAPRFDGVRWSSPHTLRDSLRACPGAVCVEPWYDVDTPEDLERLRVELERDPDAAPATAAALRAISPR